jgi:beta-phosphoglucomutase
MMPRAVIWDVDGTLVDTAELHFQAWVEVARELNKPFTRAGFAATFGRRNPDILRQLFGPDFSEEELARWGARKEELYRAVARKALNFCRGCAGSSQAFKLRDSCKRSARAPRGRTLT